MIARFVAKMIDREVNSNNKTQNEEYSEWDHLERFKFMDDLENSEEDEKELALIQSIIGKHSNESKCGHDIIPKKKKKKKNYLFIYLLFYYFIYLLFYLFIYLFIIIL